LKDSNCCRGSAALNLTVLNGFEKSKIKTKRNPQQIKRLIKIFLWTLLLAIILKSFFVEAYRIPTSSMEKTLLPGDFIFVNKAAYSISTPRHLPILGAKIRSLNLVSFSKPSRGDIVIFEFPEHREGKKIITANYIKRVIGLPRDTVEIIDNVVYVNRKTFLEDNKHLSTEKKDSIENNKTFPVYGNWNGKNYGPVVIPYKGLKVEVNFKNIDKVGLLINREYEKKVVSVEGSVINIEGKPVRDYTFKQDHYFVMGDNRHVSMDSRYWGTIPENLIIGKAELIYWSTDPDLSAFKSIRLGRLFKIIN